METFNLEKVTKIQTKILDKYRLSEDFRSLYGEYIYENYPDGDGIQSAVKAIKKYKKINENDLKNEYRDLIIDLIYTNKVLGFYYYEYFTYGFENKAINERLDFLSERKNMEMYKRLNNNKIENNILNNKLITYKKFAPFFKRKIIKVNSIKDRELFCNFVKNNDKFILKPINGYAGKEVELINCAEYKNEDEMLNYILNKEGEFILEEYIVQAAFLTDLYSKSVNTIRCYTYSNNDKAIVLNAMLKIGNGGGGKR